MPQVDLASVCCTQDRKVACETLADAASDEDSGEETPAPVIDYAPESFWLSKDAELDWLDQNAFIERKDSGKGGGGIRGGSSLSIQIPNSGNLVSNSQRYSVNLKAKASIIGLPKPQKTNYAEAKNRRSCRPASIRLFPKRSESVGSSSKQGGAAPSEPSSPKVSCMGRVRSRKDRSKRGKNRKKQGEPVLVKTKSIKVKDRKTGFWKNFRSIFRGKGHKAGCKSGEPGVEPVQVQSKSGADNRNVNGRGEGANPVGPPGLGGVKRFVSGRRSDAWAADLEVDGAKSEPLDQQRGPIWRRREKGPPESVKVERDWQSVGPASV